MEIRKGTTATGRLQLTIGGDCEGREFAYRALWFVKEFGMTDGQIEDGLDVLMMRAFRDGSTFLISWDVWTSEVTVMAWDGTSDSAIETLLVRP